MALFANPFPGPAWRRTRRCCVRRPGYALRFTSRFRGPSPAMREAIAAMQDHRRRWDAARRETLREIGSNAIPAIDGRLDLSAGPMGRRPFAGGLR